MRTATMTDGSVDVDTTDLYRLGGISAIVLGAAYLAITVAYVFAGVAPDGGQAWLDYVAGKTEAWWAIIGLSVLTDFLFLPVALALYLALRHVDRSLMVVGAGLLAMFAVLDLAVTWPSIAALVKLGGDYAAATDPAQRAGFVAAANYPASVLASSLFPVYAILAPSLGILVTGFVMSRGRAMRGAAYLGVLTGVLGVVTVVASVVIGPVDAAAILTSVLTLVWVVVVGYRLLELGRMSVPEVPNRAGRTVE